MNVLKHTIKKFIYGTLPYYFMKGYKPGSPYLKYYEYIKEHGYTKEFNHGTGHGVGLEIHEEPVANAKSDTVFSENMIITVEPGIYITGTIGLRIEDSVIVKSDGYEVLTHSPKELIEIGI